MGVQSYGLQDREILKKRKMEEEEEEKEEEEEGEEKTTDGRYVGESQ